jgi:ribosomal protein S3
MVKEKLYNSGVARIEIERRGGTVTVIIIRRGPVS